jgi:hypothetical protein
VQNNGDDGCPSSREPHNRARSAQPRATACLPGLNIEVVHRQSPDGDSEQISINLQAVPSFEAFARFLEAANPFAFWVQAGQLAWLSWLEAVPAVMLPFSSASALPKAGADAVSRFSQERRSP